MAKTMLSRIPLPATLAHEQGLLETIWLLFTSVLVVPAVCKIPGGSPVLGFLAGGALIGPHALGESMHPCAGWLDMAMM
jgi:Kef-type K+ transport system membrane component KefB